jgi:Ca-activated chloride channel homolog
LFRLKPMRLVSAERFAALVVLVTALAAVRPAGGQEVVRTPGQASEPRVTILAPRNDSYVSGAVLLRAEVVPSNLAVERLSFFANGRLVCDGPAPPFECQWDAGPRVDEHNIRVVAQFADGRRIVDTVRTRSAGYAEAVDVDVIQVTVTVTDERGKFVRGLPQRAFRLFEDNVQQKITSFVAENIPLEIIVAVDISGSMTEAMPELKAAAKTFLSALRPDDQVTLMAFNDNIFTLARPSADLDARLKAIDRLAPWGGTALYDAVVMGIELLGRRPGRRVMVVFTDGDDQSSHAALEAVERRVEASDATLYLIGQGRGGRQPALKQVLERLARTSGGRPFFPEGVGSLDQAFADIVEELSNQYLLGYPPLRADRDGSWRRIRVELTGAKGNVRSRQGYRTVRRQ